MHESANNGQKQKRKLAGSQKRCAVVEANDGLVLLQLELGRGGNLIAFLERRAFAGNFNSQEVRKSFKVFFNFNFFCCRSKVDYNDNALFCDVGKFTEKIFVVKTIM